LILVPQSNKLSQSEYNHKDEIMGDHGGKRDGAGRKAGSGKYGEPTKALRVPASLVKDVKDFIQVKKVKRQRIPLYMSGVPAGSPSFLEDHVEDYIDLNEFFIKDMEQTFMVMAEGDSMVDANIKSGDILIVDRSIEPQHGHIVIAGIDDNLTVKRLQIKGSEVSLKPENKKYAPIMLNDKNRLHIWGVVTNIIHRLMA
jgi:DNA polymerase V